MDHSDKYGAFGNRSAFIFHELLKKAMPGDNARRSFKKGDYIFEEGKNANGIFCILTGNVKITRLSNDGKEQILRLVSSRDVIGYRALLDGHFYRASAVALEDTSVGFVPRKIFFEILENNPPMAMEMLRLLSSDLDRSETRRVDIATKTVRERLAEALLLLKETYGFREDGTTINFSLSREEIAAMVGAAKEVVIRNLAVLKDENLIDTKGKLIQILNTAGLVRVARITD